MPEIPQVPDDNPPTDSTHVGSVLQINGGSAAEESFTYPCPRCPRRATSPKGGWLLNLGFLWDVYHFRKKTLIQSVRQLEDLWSQGNEYFRLYRPLNSIPTISDRPLHIFFSDHNYNASQKVNAVHFCSCAFRYKNYYFLKTIEDAMVGWRNLYHEIRQLLCMPPHPNIIGPPVALVYAHEPDTPEWISDSKEELPIVGFLMRPIDGKTLREFLGSSEGPYPTAKWCRQLTDALVHILDHGNGLDRPGYYSDLKPNNIMITSQGEDVVLIDFESGGNWRAYNPDEVEERERLLTPADRAVCRKCRGLGAEKVYTPEEHDICLECRSLGLCHSQYYRAGYDGDQDPTQSTEVPTPPLATLAHLDRCEAHWALTSLNPARRHNTTKFKYNNPPFGYLLPWNTMSQEARENAMLFSLGMVCIGICRKDGEPPYPRGDPGLPPAGVPLEYWSILARMLSPDPKQRGSLKMALHAFKDWEEKEKDSTGSCSEGGK